MKQILNVLKNEIFSQTKQIDGLVKKITASQDAYLKDRSNEELFNSWSGNVSSLQKVEGNLKALRTAYITLCGACGVEPLSNDQIVAEKAAKKAKKSSKKEENAVKGDVK